MRDVMRDLVWGFLVVAIPATPILVLALTLNN